MSKITAQMEDGSEIELLVKTIEEFPFAKFPYGSDVGKLHYSNFILIICSMCNVKSYLELGVATGETFNLINKQVQASVGVDIVDNRENKEDGKFLELSTDEFFKTWKDGTFDCIFIDASHKFEQVRKDFCNSLKILDHYGIIILDDTDPIDERHTSNEICGDAYKIIPFIRLNFPELDILTLPVWEKGMTIVRRRKDNRVNEFIDFYGAKIK